jgi:phenylalanyl-tRNA synthetase alpha subunit
VRGRRLPPLRRIHDDIYDQNTDARRSLEHHRTRTTEEIVESLRLDAEEPLRVKVDGRVFRGNTRIKVLEERCYPVNDLPRDIIP